MSGPWCPTTTYFVKVIPAAVLNVLKFCCAAYLLWILNLFMMNLKFNSLLFVEVVGCLMLQLIGSRPTETQSDVVKLQRWSIGCFLLVGSVPLLMSSRTYNHWAWLLFVACVSLHFAFPPPRKQH